MTHVNKAVTQEKTKRAIIIGGSMGGLLTARVLSEYFTEVVIVEKDELPDKPVDRAGTPQGFHPHRFTPRLKMILGRLFPGYNEVLLENGAPTTFNKHVCQINHYGKIVVGPSQEKETTCSRALLEWTIRGYIKKIPNIRFLEKHDVLGLQATTDASVITGVHLRDRTSKQGKSLYADLVLDISGRRSKLGSWLEKLGYEVPEPDRLKVSLAYSTRRFRMPTELAEKWDVIRIAGHPSTSTFTGVFSTIENDVAEVLLYGLGGKYPTIKQDEYFNEAMRLSDPSIAEVMEQLYPITAPRGFQVPELLRQRFDKMKKWPTGLLVLGDAICHVDPIFGQGITMAAIEVEMLETCLQEQQSNPRSNFEHYVLTRIQDAIEPGWWLNCAADLSWPGVEYVGEPLKGIEFASKYLELYIKHATINQNLQQYGMYWAVNTLLFSPRVLFNPEMIATVMADATAEDRQWYNEITKGIGQLTEDQLNQLIPSFSGASFVNFG
jgi:2-polyprenyl-6-methoxyphenol hydroxylase-like FAD-dependent oxidoreductase